MIITTPFLPVTARDAEWQLRVLRHLLDVHYFAGMPDLEHRVRTFVADLEDLCGQSLRDGAAARESQYVTYREASTLTSLSVRTLRRRVQSGALPVARTGRVVRIKVTDLEQMMESA